MVALILPKQFLTLAGILILLSLCAGLPPHTKETYKNLIDGKGLYEDKDKVVIVNASSFKNIISNKDNAWLVEFYNSWCGHCFIFAPKWKALAADIYGWRKVIKVAALDCSTEENNPTCRDYDIMGYPTVKFFPAHAPASAPGIELKREDIGTGTISELNSAIVAVLQKEQIDGRGTHWPNLGPVRSSDVAHLQTGDTDAAEHVFVVFEHSDSKLGVQIVLDMSAVDNVQVRTAYSNNEALASTLGVHHFPSIVYVTQGGSERLRPAEETREGFRSAIRAFLEAKGVSLPPDIPQVTASQEALPDLVELMKLHHTKAKLKTIKDNGDVVYLADLETALRYMLHHEIPVKKLIKTEAFDSLKKFLTVIAKYFPAGEGGIQYLQQLRDAVSDNTDIRGIKFKTLVKDTAGGLNSVLATEDGYIGCQGSEPHLRGYPCSVWTLFHYLTVSGLRSQDPLQVLDAMHGYITYFFGCTECSLHFQEMAASSMRAKATDADEAALWLWWAHNQVNKRLSGAATDDPEFPKMQYPSEKLCPKCRDSAGRWSEANVLQYLRNKYHQDNLNYQGANTKVAVAQRELPPSNRHLVETVEEQPQPTKYFSFLDLSICITLYCLSGVICAALFWKFVLRRHYRKKAF